MIVREVIKHDSRGVLFTKINDDLEYSLLGKNQTVLIENSLKGKYVINY